MRPHPNRPNLYHNQQTIDLRFSIKPRRSFRGRPCHSGTPTIAKMVWLSNNRLAVYSSLYDQICPTRPGSTISKPVFRSDTGAGWGICLWGFLCHRDYRRSPLFRSPCGGRSSKMARGMSQDIRFLFYNFHTRQHSDFDYCT